jgi:hypothetical protein
MQVALTPAADKFLAEIMAQGYIEKRHGITQECLYD